MEAQSETKSKEQIARKKRDCRLATIMVLIVVLTAAIGTGVAMEFLYGQLSNVEVSTDEPAVSTDDVSTDEPAVDTRNIFMNASVAASSTQCSVIGRDMMMNGGGAIDAAIAAFLCEGLHRGHSAGIGGGCFILYYDRENKTTTFIDARERAPAAASRDMFVNASDDASTFGGLSIGVPGELKGYAEAHRLFGKLPWAELFAPSIRLAEEGFIVQQNLAYAMRIHEGIIVADRSLSKILTDGEGNILKEGDTIYRPELAKTYRAIAEEGAEVFYTGVMAETIASEIQARDGIITAQDLADYEVEIRTPINIQIDDSTAYSGGPPSSGAVFSLILNIMEGYNLTAESIQSVEDEVLLYHRVIEAFKFAFAKRSALGDESFTDVAELVANMTSQDFADDLRAMINDGMTYNYTYYDPAFQFVSDSGTSHMAVVDQFGNSASITSTINLRFGSKVRGETTGIIYNNEMDDFAVPGAANYFGIPPSPSNFIVPGKRPQSSMTPVIMVNAEGDVQFVVGGAGGPRIITGISLVTIFNQWLGDTLEDSIERRRVHHQLVPEYPIYEPGFPSDILEGLASKGHAPTMSSIHISEVQGIRRLVDGRLSSHTDRRGGGLAAGF